MKAVTLEVRSPAGGAIVSPYDAVKVEFLLEAA